MNPLQKPSKFAQPPPPSEPRREKPPPPPPPPPLPPLVHQCAHTLPHTSTLTPNSDTKSHSFTRKPSHTPPGLTQTHPGVIALERYPDSTHADECTLVLTRTQMHTSLPGPTPPQRTHPHTRFTQLHVHTSHIHTPSAHARARTPACTLLSASAHRKRARTHSLPTRAPPLPVRAHLYEHTPLPPELQEPRGTYWVPSCEAGRSVLPRAPNGICIHGSPQPRARARGRGCGVPFPKLGAGARSAAAPGGAWARGAAPPARSACARTSAALRPRTPARAPGAGGGS